MRAIPRLHDLGPRLMILGRSNAGKSTLAAALAQKLSCPCYHLDQIAHIPGTDWQKRPEEEWFADHDRLIGEESWIIEGNYQKTMPQRLQRATAVLWLDPSLWGCLRRYVARSFRRDPHRPGGLQDAQGELSWTLIHYMTFTYPKNCLIYQRLIAEASPPVFLRLKKFKDVLRLYQDWDLPQPIK